MEEKYIFKHLLVDKSNNDNSFSMKIGGTTFDVTTFFDDTGTQSVLKQFKDLILSGYFTQ